MKTEYIEGVNAGSKDNEINNKIKKGNFNLGGKTFITAVKNDDGEIYRKIETNGLGELMSITSILASLGFVDSYFELETPINGIDCLFEYK